MRLFLHNIQELAVLFTLGFEGGPFAVKQTAFSSQKEENKFKSLGRKIGPPQRKCHYYQNWQRLEGYKHKINTQRERERVREKERERESGSKTKKERQNK